MRVLVAIGEGNLCCLSNCVTLWDIVLWRNYVLKMERLHQNMLRAVVKHIGLYCALCVLTFSVLHSFLDSSKLYKLNKEEPETR